MAMCNGTAVSSTYSNRTRTDFIFVLKFIMTQFGKNTEHSQCTSQTRAVTQTLRVHLNCLNLTAQTSRDNTEYSI